MNLSRFLHRKRWDGERARELETYLELEADQNMEAGMTSAEARATARRKLGNPIVIREAIYEMNTISFLDSLWRDFRLSLRNLRRNPSFAVVVVLTLGLGIGANTAIFSVADGLLYRPLPVPDPNGVVSMDTAASRETNFGGSSYQDWVDIRARAQSFQDIALVQDLSASLSPAGAAPGISPQLVQGLMVSDNFFSTMRVQPVLGRGFLPDEGKVPGRNPVAVISNKLWREVFSSDPAAIGRQIRVNGHSFTIVGIAPESFTGIHLFSRPDVYLPLMMTADLTADGVGLLVNRSWRSFDVLARLREGVTLERAQAEITVLMRDLERQHPDTNKNTVGIIRYEIARRTEGQGSLPPKILLGLVTLVLLIACANVASLMMAKAASRLRETSTQLAMGATRGRLVRQFLTECVVLAAIGGGVGLLVALASIRGLAALLPPGGALIFQIDLRALVCAAGASLIAILFGLAPALLSVREAWAAVATTRTAVSGRRSFNGFTRRVLIGGQVALSVILLITAGLFVQAFGKAAGTNFGFRTDHVLLVELDPSLQGVTGDEAARFHRQLVERTAALPGVKSASFAAWVPFVSGDSWDLSIDGYTTPAGDKFVDTTNNRIAPGYFATLGIAVRCGRDFTWHDDKKAPLVAIVNETLARRYLIGSGSLDKAPGHILRLREGIPIQVVGVVADSNSGSIGRPTPPVLYLPATQMGGPHMTLHVRTSGDAAALTPLVRREIAALNPEVVPITVDTLSNVISDQGLFLYRTIATLTGAFGFLGLTLSVIGLYGVVSFMVGRRTQEIGVRMALGASRGAVLRMVLSNGVSLAVVGLAVGLAASMAVTRLMTSMLLGISPWDLETFVLIAAVLLVAAVFACWIPATRAMRVDPMTALRYE